MFAEQLLSLLLDDSHLCLEGFFQFVGSNLIKLWVTATVYIFFQLGFTLSNMQLVESGLQIVHLLFQGRLFAMCQFTHTLQNFLFGLILLALSNFSCFLSLCYFSWFNDFNSFCCFNFWGFHYALFYGLLLVESFFLRVHH